MIPVISIVASKSNTGKTTVLCEIISILKERGLRVATLKHDAHGFEMDQPGKDTWKHRKAGSDIVMISSAKQFAMIEQVDQEYSLDEILRKITNVDIILTEGYKKMDKPKIEVFRKGISEELISKEENLLAIVTDTPLVTKKEIPQFSFSDVGCLVDYFLDALGV